MLRVEKEEKVALLHEAFAGSEVVIITHQQGLSVGETTALRRKVREANCGFRVTKNRLARIALEGTAFEPLSDMFTGPTAVVFSNDPVAAAKVVFDFAKTNQKVSIVGGALGAQILDPAGVEALTKLPSLEELRARLVGVLQQPAAKVVGVLEAPAGKLARVINTPPQNLVGVFKAYAATGEAA